MLSICHFKFVHGLNYMGQLFSQKCMPLKMRRRFEESDLVSSITEWQMTDAATRLACRIACAPVYERLTQKWRACFCFAHSSMCLVESFNACVPLCVLPAERSLIRPWEYPLWQTVRMSFSFFWHSPLITTPQFCHCSLSMSSSISGRPRCGYSCAVFNSLISPKGVKWEMQMDIKSASTNRVKPSHISVYKLFICLFCLKTLIKCWNWMVEIEVPNKPRWKKHSHSVLQ